MINQPEGLRPPRGLTRLAFRLPIWLYRLRLGWLLGDRLLLLHHTGRKSGHPRETVLEVVRHDPAAGWYIVAAGFGESSDWFQNLQHNPQARIQVARRIFPVVAERIPFEIAVDEFRKYANRYPGALKALSRFLGVTLSGTEEDYPHLARLMPLIRLTPNHSG